MKFFAQIIIAVLLFSSALLAQQADVQLISPIDGKEVYIDDVDFHFKYLAGETGQEDATCVLSIDDSPVATILAKNQVDAYFNSKTVASGNRVWSVSCNGIDSSHQTFYKKPQAAAIELISPNDSLSTFDSDIVFKFRYYAGETGNDTAQCYLNIAYQQRGPLTLPSGETGEIEITQIPKRDYEWYISCDNITSQTRMLSAMHFIPASVESLSPEVGAVFNHNNPEFDFIYRAGTSGPKEAVCNLVVYPFREATLNATDGVKTTFSTSGLKNGTQYWYAECNFGTEHYATSGDAREFTITKDSPKENISEGQNQSEPQGDGGEPIVPEMPQAVLIAPTTASINQQVQIKLLGKDGNPISNATVQAILASGSTLPIFTDENGVAIFTAPSSPMSISYIVVGYELAQAPFTNIVFATPNQTQPQTPEKNQSTSQIAPPPDNTYTNFVIIFAVLALVAGAYFLFFKPKPKKPVAEDEASVGQSKPAPPPSPTTEEN